MMKEDPKIKQVFTHYSLDPGDTQGFFKYCPRCATPLALVDTDHLVRPVCPSCGFIQFKNPSPSVVVLVVEEGQVLLGQRLGEPCIGKWAPPSGYIEFHDDFISAGVREVKEETGLEVEIQSVLNVVSCFLTSRYHFLAITLQARVIGGNLLAGDDLNPVDWFPLSQPLPEMAFDEDIYAIGLYKRAEFPALPVDPDFASPRR